MGRNKQELNLTPDGTVMAMALTWHKCHCEVCECPIMCPPTVTVCYSCTHHDHEV